MKNTKTKNTENQEQETITVETVTAETTTENTENTTEATAENTENTKKTVLETLLDTQKQLVEMVVDNTKNFVNGIQPTETIQKTRENINEWLEKQQGNLETLSSEIKKRIAFEKAPETVKQVIEAQESLGKEWFEALRTTLKVENLEGLKGILNANVDKLRENVKEVTSNIRENITNPTKINISDMFSVEFAKNTTTKWIEMLKPAK